MKPASHKPWLFLDLDGVVSPVPSQAKKARIRSTGPPRGFRTWPGAIYDMYVDERLLDWTQQLDRAYDVVWASTWGDMLLPVVAKPLGLDHWPVLGISLADDEGTGGPLRHKAQAIADRLAEDPRPFAWCDDFLTLQSATKALATIRLPHLFVRPGSRTGLTPVHVERLLEFARQQMPAQPVKAG